MNLLAEAASQTQIPEFAPALVAGVAWATALLVVSLFFCVRALRDERGPTHTLVTPWAASWSDFAIFIWLLVVFYLGCNFLLAGFSKELSPMALTAFSGMLTQGGFLLCFWLTARFVKPDLMPGLNTIPIPFFSAAKLALGRFLACYPLIVLASIIMMVAAFFWGLLGIDYTPTAQDLVLLLYENAESPWLPLFIMLTVFVAPVAEELVFRGTLYRFCKSRLSARWAYILPNVLFGLIHFDLFSFLPLCAAGMFFTWAYERSGNIVVPIVCHALLNANTLLMMALS